MNEELSEHQGFLKRWLSKLQPKHVVMLLFVLSLGISLQCYLISIGKEYTRYNNYVIFKYAFHHLVEHKNLYIAYAQEHFDFYKYSPSFALSMAVFSWMPDWLGVNLFNFLNLGVFLWGLFRLKLSPERMKYVLLFLFVEVGISLSSIQTNLLIAGCIMLAFSYLEKEKIFIAACFVVATVFIKLFGIVAFALFLLYPGRIKAILYSAFWIVAIGILPMIVESPEGLASQYLNWWTLLKDDHSSSVGLSFMGWMKGWFGLDLPKLGVVLTAAFVFCLPLLKIGSYGLNFFRMQILSSVLLWIVIFNHKGESPTYVIAMAGVAVWYFSQKPAVTNLVLLWLCLIFTSFSSTDAITPLWITAKYVDPYSLKAVFCSIIWFKLIYELMTDRGIQDPSVAIPTA